MGQNQTKKVGDMLEGKLLARSEFGITCMTAYRVFSQKEMNLTELEYCMAEVMLPIIHHLEPQNLPLEPEILREFKSTKRLALWKKKKTVDKEALAKELFEYEEVKSYIKKHSEAKYGNLMNMEYLESYIVMWLDIGEQDNAKKCWDIYSRFPGKRTVKEMINENG